MKVITGPHWLFEMFNNMKNEKGTAQIIPVFDKFDRPILGINVLKDPDWSGIGEVTTPEGEKKSIMDLIQIIDFEPKEEEFLFSELTQEFA